MRHTIRLDLPDHCPFLFLRFRLLMDGKHISLREQVRLVTSLYCSFTCQCSGTGLRQPGATSPVTACLCVFTALKAVVASAICLQPMLLTLRHPPLPLQRRSDPQQRTLLPRCTQWRRLRRSQTMPDAMSTRRIDEDCSCQSTVNNITS